MALFFAAKLRWQKRWASSSVGLERTPDKREVGSSTLPRPTIEISDLKFQISNLRSNDIENSAPQIGNRVGWDVLTLTRGGAVR